MTGIIDYGCGNLFSLLCTLKKIGELAQVISEPAVLSNYERLILPGVGAFGGAAEKLRKSGLGEALKERAAKGVPVLGICLGMQLLFGKSYEYGEHEGLALLRGEIRSLSDAAQGLKIPHMGWNSLHIKRDSALFKYVQEGDYVYFVHSFYADGRGDDVLATSRYGAEICAAAGKGNVYGTQFHPEKSGDTGLKILKAFTEI